MLVIHFIKKNILAFWLSLLYVILAGIAACAIYPGDPLNGEWLPFGMLITLPVSIFGVGFRMYETADYFPVVVIQAILFIPTFFLFIRIISKRKKSKTQDMQQ